jgi:hypothetical protein
MKLNWLAASVSVIVLASATSAGLCAEAGRTRDPALWPFTSTSPWNMPIGDKAQYVGISSPKFDSSGGGGINCTKWSHPIFIATVDDPMTTIYLHPRTPPFPPTAEKPFVTMRVPVNARPDSESDEHLHIIDETHSFVVEMIGAVRDRNGKITVTWGAVKNSLRDAGVYDTPYHGTRAYGGSAIGGLIRKGELTHGIHHALAVTIEPKAHNRNGPGGKPYVWPASSADGDADTAYGTTGNLYMGTLLAIPPTVDITKLGLQGPDLVLARALQDYGAYVSDSGGANFQLAAEPTAKDEVAQVKPEKDWSSLCSLRKLVALVKIVANNSPQSVGGGGKPRCPLAPPLAPSPH